MSSNLSKSEKNQCGTCLTLTHKQKKVIGGWKKKKKKKEKRDGSWSASTKIHSWSSSLHRFATEYKLWYVTYICGQKFSPKLCNYKTTINPISSKALEKLVFSTSGITLSIHRMVSFCLKMFLGRKYQCVDWTDCHGQFPRKEHIFPKGIGDKSPIPLVHSNPRFESMNE